MRRNVELKAHDRDPLRTRTRLHELAALSTDVLEQRDTYFAVPQGRLKLREERGRGAALISYRRPDIAEARASEYELVDVPDPARLMAALEHAIEIRGVVAKRRELFLWEETVRVHLDEVEGLGSFVEIEAVAADGSDLTREHDQLARLRAALGLQAADLVSGGYADLLLG